MWNVSFQGVKGALGNDETNPSVLHIALAFGIGDIINASTALYYDNYFCFCILIHTSIILKFIFGFLINHNNDI